MRPSHSILREGLIAGLLGGASVALWFLIRDTLAGVPLRTPSVLGELFLFGVRGPDPEAPQVLPAALYTVVHFLVFVLFGLGIAVLVRWAVQEPVARFGVMVVFVVFELFFYVLLRVMGTEVQGLFPAWAVLGANLLAALAMGGYFWRHYPELRRILRVEPLGT